MATSYRRTVREVWLGQPATAQNVVPATAGLITTPKALFPTAVPIFAARALNRGSGASAVALVGLLADDQWKAGQWTHATTLYADDTTDAQDAGTNDFALETTTVDDGFVVQALAPFGAVSLDITTAGSGTSPTHVIEYWNGTAWIAIAAVGTLIDVTRAADWATGEKVVLFDPPTDWAKGGGANEGIDTDKYAIRVRRTNATQATAALARRLYVGVVFAAQDAVAADAEMVRQFSGLDVPLSVAGVSAVFATKDEGNAVEIVHGHII
jgi:hypothetical protein